MIQIAKPIIEEDEINSVVEVLRSGNIAQGKKVEEFELLFASYIGVKHAIATNNGTTALIAALLANDIKLGDEVITTSFSFIASATSILFTGAKPVFVDVEDDTFNIDPEKIEERITSKTKAIIPVHLYGQSANINEIIKIANKYNLKIIEDACQAHGAEFNGDKVGSFATGCFSFYPTKNITTGEGGMITTNNDEVARKARLIRNHGMPQRYIHEVLGYNFRMTDINAAIGIEQLKKLDSWNKKRIYNANKLNSGISREGIQTPYVSKKCKHVYHQYTIRVTSNCNISRDYLQQKLTENGIGSMIYYPIPIHKQKLFVDLLYKDILPITEKLSKEVLSIPVHPLISDSELNYIIKSINDIK